MVRPTSAAWNPETAGDNAFQGTPPDQNLADQARREFDDSVGRLQRAGLRIDVIEGAPDLPDAVFPNNWFSTHEDGRLVVYPMTHPSRRREIRQLSAVLEKIGPREVVDLSDWAERGWFLEGTGSLVLDRTHRVAYAAISPRTSIEAVEFWCQRMGYQPLVFETAESVYHTNVVLALGSGWAVLAKEAIVDPNRVITPLLETGHRIWEVSSEAMAHYAANVLATPNGVIVSETALPFFEETMRNAMGPWIPLAIPSIERLGGGSARCMLAEIFEPRGYPLCPK